MLARSHLERILGDESLTRGLRDSEARLLVEWLVDQAEHFGLSKQRAEEMDKRIQQLCRRARALRRFIELWFDDNSRAAACQLVGAERWEWPMPDVEADPYEALYNILAWESDALAQSAQAA
ncbi:hypothetical protein BH10PLA2_BH10PLA2_31340 [soil metagenome]